jgi:predicted PhzF superfamily epimerase YddE/YHI9
LQLFILIEFRRLYVSSRFTPTKEVELCGHATLAAAHILVETYEVDINEPIYFETIHSGILIAKYQLTERSIQLSFPVCAPQQVTLSTQEMTQCLQAFGLEEHSTDVLYIGRTIYDLFIELSSTIFHQIKVVNYSALEIFGGRGVIITCAGERLGGEIGPYQPKQCDFYSRFFAPL